MAKSQQDQTWPYRPPVNFYPQQVYNLPYHHPGVCQDSCCQPPRVNRNYRSLPYPSLAYPHQGGSFTRQTTQAVPQYVPVNPYIPQRNCPSQHQRNPLIHRPIPQNRYDYNEYYRLNSQRFVLNKTSNTNEGVQYGHENPQFSSNHQYTSCNYTSQPTESNLPNIDVRQFLATWQEKDEDVPEPSDHITNQYQVNFNPDPYQPLDCTKRSDTLDPNCEFDPARAASYFTKSDLPNNDGESPSITYQQYSNTSPVITGITNVNISSGQINNDNCAAQQMEQHHPEKVMDYIPFERSIEKISNPRSFKSPVINNPHKTIIDNSCSINETVYHNNMKDFKHSSERSQYHLSASLENDDLFDDINRKKEEKQKNVVHPLRREDNFDRSQMSINKLELPHIPIKPNVNIQHHDMPTVPCDLPDKYSDDSVTVDLKNKVPELIQKNVKKKNRFDNDCCTKKTIGKYSLEFRPLCNDTSPNNNLVYEGAFNIVPNDKSAIPALEKPVHTNTIDNQMFANNDSLEKNLLNCSNTQIVAPQNSNYPLRNPSLDQLVLPEEPKKPNAEVAQEMEISSDDIDISIASSGDLVVDEDDAPVDINNLKECLKLPEEIVAKVTCLNYPKVNPSEEFDTSHPTNIKTVEDKIVIPKDDILNVNITTCPIINYDKKTFNDCTIPSTELNNNEIEIKEGLEEQSNAYRILNKTSNKFNGVVISSNVSPKATSQNGNVTNALQDLAFSYQDFNVSEDSADSASTLNHATNPFPSNSKFEVLNVTNRDRNKKQVIVNKTISKSYSNKPFKQNAIFTWKLKNRLLSKKSKSVKNSLILQKMFSSKKNHLVKPRFRTIKSIHKNKLHKTGTLDILTECSNNNCEVNCVIYQSDIDSYNRCELNSIIAEEVHICSKCHQDINYNICSQENNLNRKCKTNENNDENSSQNENENKTENNKRQASKDFTLHNECNISISDKNELSYTIATDSNNKKLQELISNFFSSGKGNIESEVTSLEKPEIINEIIIKDAEEVKGNDWNDREDIVKNVSQRESIKCSLAWEKIFSSLFEKNNTFNNDSLELGPAKIHLTLSPKNDAKKGKINEHGELNIFKAIINAKKLILKRNGILEERIPKMVIKKSEGQGYRSFIKDVRITSNNVKTTDTNQIIKFPFETPTGKEIYVELDECELASSSNNSEDINEDKELKPKQMHHCLLCQRSFLSFNALQAHETSRFHRHLDIVQRNALHKVYKSLYGCDHPNCQPLSDLDKTFLDWKPFYPGYNHKYHNAPP